MLLAVGVAFVVIAMTAYLSLLESSLVATDDLKLVTILSRKPDNKKTIKTIFRRKREHLSAIVLLSTLVSIAGSSFIGALAAREFDDLGLAIFTALLTYCMLVFAKMLPKVRAVQVAERVVTRRAGLIRLIYVLTRPVLVLALFWIRLFPAQVAESQSRDDLRSIIKHYNKQGVIGKSQRQLAEAALMANQTTLAELPGESASAHCLSVTDTVVSVTETLRQHPCKRYLAVDGEEVVGVVLYRHLARSLVSGEADIPVGQLVRKTISLSPDITLAKAFNEFQKARVSVALLSGAVIGDTRCITVKQLYRALLSSG